MIVKVDEVWLLVIVGLKLFVAPVGVVVHVSVTTGVHVPEPVQVVVTL